MVAAAATRASDTAPAKTRTQIPRRLATPSSARGARRRRRNSRRTYAALLVGGVDDQLVRILEALQRLFLGILL
ncbi:MAG TPA: hypothetical protein VIF57_31800, partial [Polyangia bacterium]